MYRSTFLVAGLAATGILSAIACSSSTTEPPATTEPTGLPPEAGPQKAPPADAPTRVYAINKLFLGSTDRNGKTNKSSAWKEYGFNLDGKVSTEASKDLCKPHAGGLPKTIYPDGNNGIDNSFGKNVLQLILAAASDAEISVNDSILEGSFTIMLHVDKFGPESSYNPLVAKLYAGGDLGATPKFDGTDEWPVLPELLDNKDDITSSKIKFSESYLIDDMWVSGTKAPINLSLTVSGFTLNLTIGSALMAMKFDREHNTATEGTIAGVLETAVLAEELKKVVGAFDESFCGENPTVEGILNQIRQASDIMKDGSQDPTKECDGISIGLGFNMAEVKLGAIAEPGKEEDPCAGGTGGAGGDGAGGAGGGGTGGAGGSGGAGGA